MHPLHRGHHHRHSCQQFFIFHFLGKGGHLCREASLHQKGGGAYAERLHFTRRRGGAYAKRLHFTRRRGGAYAKRLHFTRRGGAYAKRLHFTRRRGAPMQRGFTSPGEAALSGGNWPHVAGCLLCTTSQTWSQTLPVLQPMLPGVEVFSCRQQLLQFP